MHLLRTLAASLESLNQACSAYRNGPRQLPPFLPCASVRPLSQVSSRQFIEIGVLKVSHQEIRHIEASFYYGSLL